MQFLQALVHAIKGDDPNDYKLLTQFFDQTRNDQISIHQLYQNVRENQDERITGILIQVFGYLSFQIVQAKIEQAKKLQDPKVQAKIERAKKAQAKIEQAKQPQDPQGQTQTEQEKNTQTVKTTTDILENYPQKLKSIFDDVVAILHSAAMLDPSHAKLASDHKFTWLPAKHYSNFSWGLNHAADPIKPDEYLRRGLVLGVIAWPMPKSLVSLLNLECIPYVKQCLDSLNARSSQAIADIYKYLTPAQPGIYLPFQFTLPRQEANVNLQAEEEHLTESEKNLRREECLLKLAAFAGFPVLNSWIDEILAWGKKYDQMAKVTSLFKKFKLTHLIVDQTYLNTLSNSPHVSLRRKLPVPAESQQAEQVFPEQKTPSFQDYLIQKSLTYLQEEFSLSPTAYQALKDLFYSKEPERIHLLFVVYAFKALHRTPHDFDYHLLEMMTESYHHIPQQPALARLFKIYGNLLKSVDPITAHYAYAFLALFFLKHRFTMEIKPAQQALLIDYFAQLNTSGVERTLAGLEELLQRLPSDSHQSLSTLARTDLAPQDFFRCLVWELYVRSHLPSICCKDLIELYSTLPLEQFKRVRLCVHQWLQLYPQSQKKLGLDEQLILFESTLPEPVVVGLFSQSFSEGLTLLNTHVSKTTPAYSFLHATLCFIYWNHYLSFSSRTQTVIFTSIQRTSVEHRELCVDSWLTFGSCLPVKAQTSTIQAAREQVLYKAYEAKSKTWIDCEGLRQCLQQQPFPLEHLMDVQVQFLQRVEHLIQGPVPLITYLMLVWYCPFFPDEFNDKSTCLSKLMDDLQKLKTSSNLKHFKNLFIHPAWVTQCDDFTKIDNQHLLLSAMYYFNFPHAKKGHLSNLINYIGPIKSAITSAVLPALPFQENLCAQAEDLFKCAGKNFPAARQNRIYYYADATMNGNIHAGEWHSIGYMMEWKLSESNGQRHPVFSIVLWQSFYRLQSREIRIPLELPFSKLRPKLHPLLGKMLLTLGEDIADIQNPQEIARLEKELSELKALKVQHKYLMPNEQAKLDQIERKLNLHEFLDRLTTTQEELDFCLKFYNDQLTVDYKAALADPSLKKADLLSLFKFVKALKIQTRQAQADLLQHTQDWSKDPSASSYSVEWLAGQGNVYCTANGLSLIPPPFETPAFYRIENTAWAHELNILIQRLRTTNEAFEISDLLKLPLSEDVEETVSVSFTPYLNRDFEPGEDEISSYLDQYQIEIPSSLAPSRSQTQLLDKLVQSDLEDLKEHVIKTRGLLLARQLYTRGWDVNQPLKNGTTPLVTAVQCHQTPVVLWLLLKGADPTRADPQGLTPLAAAQLLEDKGNMDLTTARKKIPIGTNKDIYQVNGRKCNSLDEIKEARKELEESALTSQKMGQDLKKLLNGVNAIKEHFLRVNELTFKFKNQEEVFYSCKLMNFLNHDNLENFLRWQLLKLKSRHYESQLHSIPHGHISTFLGIEERLAPPHLQTDSFENLDFKQLLLSTCEPLDQLMLQQDPPFKLHISDAKTLYEESAIYEKLSLSVQNDPDYQQLRRFKPIESPSQPLIGGACVNNYPVTFRGGVINCDMFYAEQDSAFIFSILADGCGTGSRSREAAQRAVVGVVTYLHQSLNHPLYSLKTAQELACILVRSLAYAHDNMLKGRGIADESGTTTINICFAFQDAEQKKHLMTVGLGDSKAFLVHLSGNYAVEDVADRQHNNHDIKDPGGRLGPYRGNNGKSENIHDPDLRNLSISCCPLPEKDYIVFNMSDGVHDNFDPEVLMKTPHQCDETLEENTTWKDLKDKDADKYQQLKNAYQKQTLSRLVREAIEQGKQTSDEICEYITSYCHQATESKRKPMEEDSRAGESYAPGKMDHCSVVAFRG